MVKYIGETNAKVRVERNKAIRAKNAYIRAKKKLKGASEAGQEIEVKALDAKISEEKAFLAQFNEIEKEQFKQRIKKLERLEIQRKALEGKIVSAEETKLLEKELENQKSFLDAYNKQFIEDVR